MSTMNTSIEPIKFIVIPYELVAANAMCNLDVYHRNYIISILDTALSILGLKQWGEWELNTLPHNDPVRVMANQIAGFIRVIDFNNYRIRRVNGDYILELWYAPHP